MAATLENTRDTVLIFQEGTLQKTETTRPPRTFRNVFRSALRTLSARQMTADFCSELVIHKYFQLSHLDVVALWQEIAILIFL